MHLTARAAEDAALDLSVELVLEAVAFVVDSFEQGLDVLVGQSVGREGGHRDQGRDDERACRCHEPEGRTTSRSRCVRGDRVFAGSHENLLRRSTSPSSCSSRVGDHATGSDATAKTWPCASAPRASAGKPLNCSMVCLESFAANGAARHRSDDEHRWQWGSTKYQRQAHAAAFERRRMRHAAISTAPTLLALKLTRLM